MRKARLLPTVEPFNQPDGSGLESSDNPMINAFESSVYSEELYPVTEQEHDKVLAMIAAESDWQGYDDLSREVESENFVVFNGQLRHKPEPPSKGRVGGIEI